MKLFHKHDWKISECSNVVQHDEMGYTLRLVILKCDKCGKTEQNWIDSCSDDNDVECKWIK